MKTILCSLLILFGLTSAFSQERVISKSEFDVLLKNATEIFKTIPYRVMVSAETKVNGKPQESSSSKTLIQVAGADKRHFVREYRSQKENKKSEFLQIGGKTFTRENEGKWQESTMPNNSAESRIKTISEQSEFRWIGRETLNNQSVDIYKKISTSKRLDTLNNQEILSTETVKYWIGANGALLKREMERENRRGENVFHFRNTAMIEYDKNIQVIAPIL